MKALIVATSNKPKKFTEELRTRQRYHIEYLKLSEQLPAHYMDYDPPWMHSHKLIRKLEERIHIDFFWAYQIAQKVKQEKFDIVLSMSERIAVPLGVMLDPQVKHIAILHNAMAPKWLLTIKLLNLPRHWTHVITNSQAEAEALKAALSIDADKISSIPTYVDLDFFNPNEAMTEAEMPSFVLSHGLSKRDYPTLIRAMHKLPHVTCQISAVSAWDKFKAGYEGMDIPANVQLKSFNHPSLIKNVTAQSRFVVIPLRPDTGMWSAGSASVLQAQALGRPVIVTYLPGIAEYVKDGVTGYLVKGNDPDALAAAIDRLWQNPAQTAEMGRTAQKWVSENFSLQNYVDRFSDLVKQTVQKRKVRREPSSLDVKTKPRQCT